MWDITTPAAARLVSPLPRLDDPVLALRFSPDGRTLATAGKDGKVCLWDVTDASSPHLLGVPLTVHMGRVWSVAFSADGRTLAASGPKNLVLLWDVADRASPARLPC